MTLTDFLLARIAEDEVTANGGPLTSALVDATREALPGVDVYYGMSDGRLLAECEAKRRIVGLHQGMHDCKFVRGHDECATLTFLALPYADHPDFREEWRG